MSMHTRVSIIALFALAACGDSDTKGKVEETAPEIVDVIEIEAEVIVFVETQETQAEATSPPDGTAETTVEPDTRAEVDGGEGCRTFGCPCTANNACLDELCIESADGNVCTRTCVADCPANFDCLAVTSFGDPVSVCVPRHTRLCRPCRTDAQCDDPGDPYPAYCLSDPSDDPIGATGSFCGSSCANRDCPEGYLCQDTALSGGGTAKQCVPASGECTCRSSWSALGYSTDCAVTNVFGSCDGARSCTVNGLSACIGQQATQEICDNVDNDCDGTTDILDDTPCMVQNGNGQCPGMLGCSAGAPMCMGPEPLPETCNGIDDNCNSSTDENTCNDNLACTTDSCLNGSECAHELIGGNCLVAGACYQAGGFNPQNSCEVCDPVKSQVAFSQSANTCVIGGQCYPPNTTNPTNACQICLPGQSTTAWSAASNTCQIGGECYGGNQANPANPCEICSPVSSTTTWTQALNTCNIQGQCYAAGFKDPNNECVVCDPTRSATGWSNASSNVSCDDANACSATSFCDGSGACRGDATCNDNVECTTDTCDSRTGCRNEIAPNRCRIAGQCRNDGEDDPANQCRECRPTISTSAFSNKTTGSACSDGNACTLEDTCNASGTCIAGGPKPCSDANVCTSDVCDPATGACSYPAQAGGCDDADACTNSDSCSGGSCAGTPKVDQYESNNTATAARSVAPNAICDNGTQNEPAGNFTATIYGAGDVDWYKFRIDDDCANFRQPSPWVRMTNVPSASNFRLCVFWDCDANGSDTGSCEDGGGDSVTENVNGLVLKGCCSDKTGSSGEFVYYYPDCSGNDETGTAYFRVNQTGGSLSCEAYSIAFGDD